MGIATRLSSALRRVAAGRAHTNTPRRCIPRIEFLTTSNVTALPRVVPDYIHSECLPPACRYRRYEFVHDMNVCTCRSRGCGFAPCVRRAGCQPRRLTTPPPDAAGTASDNAAASASCSVIPHDRWSTEGTVMTEGARGWEEGEGVIGAREIRVRMRLGAGGGSWG